MLEKEIINLSKWNDMTFQWWFWDTQKVYKVWKKRMISKEKKIS